MGLAEYNRKRDFKLTREPPGDDPPSAAKDRKRGRRFVIQKHAASHLHYDFRLELEGVLKSWSVPKGPCLDPKVKRLAMQTEDHPLAYATFEGIIPAGQYGGGTVLLWDQGTWEPQGDNPHKEFAAGNLKFVLKGDKLHGKWALVRIGGRGGARAGGRGDERSWLLIKERDEEAQPAEKYDITQARPESVTTKRTLEEIAAERTNVWHSNRDRVDPSAAPGARAAKLPARLQPQQPRRAAAPPEQDGWLHEMALDGVRLLARVDDGEVRLLSARGTALPAAEARRLAPVAKAVRLLPADSVLVDGVVTALGADGRASAEALDDALAGRGGTALAYYLRDLPYLDGYDLSATPLEQRKRLLGELVGRVREESPLRYAEHIAGGGDAFHREACRLGIPAMLSRRADGRYPGARGSAVEVACAPKAKTKPKTTAKAKTKAAAAKPAAATRVTAKGAARPRADVAAHARTARPSAADTQVAGQRLSHPDRVLYPDAGLTKLDLAHYYERVADALLPHIEGRPLSLVRCPEGAPTEPGSRGSCFYVKHAGVSAPAALERVKIQERTKVGEYMVARDLPGVIALVQMSILEIHVWGSCVEELERPDRVIFDLDPDPSVPWPRVVEAARELRRRMEALELVSFVKTTGGKGLHVVVPFRAEHDWDTCFAFSRAVSERLEREAPEGFTTDMSKAVRKGKILIDYLRNNRGSTAVAPYSTRARPGAPVSVPLAWDELTDDLHPLELTVATVPARVQAQARKQADPWAALPSTRQRLTEKILRAAGALAPELHGDRGGQRDRFGHDRRRRGAG